MTDMKFKDDIVHKIVIRENDSTVKSFRGFIIDTNPTYLTLKFINDDVKVFLNHSFIISIVEAKE